MDGQIAIATLSGRAYYSLISELKKRHLPFLSLTPTDSIPPQVKIVITTAKEKRQVKHLNVLVYDSKESPSKIIDKALQGAYGKGFFRKTVVGVDPGKTVGVAIICDDIVLKTLVCHSVKDAVSNILNTLNEIRAEEMLVRIGDGAEPYRRLLIGTLNKELPLNVPLETVSEKGTTRVAKTLTSHRRGLLDAASAVEIALRSGGRIMRRRQ